MRMAVPESAAIPASPRRSLVIQRKTRIGPVDDPLEHEANRVADAVVAGRAVGTIAGAEAEGPQRACAQCEGDEEIVQRECATCSGEQHEYGGAAEMAANAVSRGGAPLTAGQRRYFEPRFGRDLSGIRVHTGDEAASAASDINARAYTVGNNIGFARGEYQPGSGAGRHLIAHELTHTQQQDHAMVPVVRRAKYGAGAPPQFNDSTWTIVPEDEKARVDEALAQVDAVVADSNTYAECHDQFAERCPNGNRNTLTEIWRRANIWKITQISRESLAAAPDRAGSDIGYTALGYGQSPVELASSLMHEAGHNCGIRGTKHWHAELVSNYCMGPGKNEISLGGGAGLSGSDPLALISYRRFLGDWAGGRLRGTLGADLNTYGIISAIAERGQAAEGRTVAEYGSAMIGVQARLGGWGGTRYGGLSFRVETGFGVGRFALRPATPGEAGSTAVAPSWILQVGPRAEFLIKEPFSESGVIPITVGVAARLTAPLNGEARALQGGLLSVGGVF